MCFALHIDFANGVKVTVKFDNLVEMQAMLRGVELVNRETHVVSKIWIEGAKTYDE